MARTGESFFCFLTKEQFDGITQMKLCVDLNTDDNKCGVPLNTFAHNQIFVNHKSLLTSR